MITLSSRISHLACAPSGGERWQHEYVKTIQIRKSKPCYSQPPPLAFGRDSKWENLREEKREGYRYVLIGGSWTREAVGGKTRSCAYYVMGKDVYLALSGWS